jgi:hypothetical protein
MKMVDTGGKTPVETYAWLCGDQRCDTIDCYKSSWDSQTVTHLWEAKELTSFHDAELSKATKKINGILTKIEKGNKDKKRKLSFIEFQNRLLIVWAGYGVVGPDDDDKTVMKALGLRSR